MKLYKGLYTIDNASLYINVLKIYHQSETKIVAKLQFQYKNGDVCEIKSYNLVPNNITHWRKIYDY